MNAIELHNLHKRFGDLRAVQGVSLAVKAGEIVSLLGPNGAGKTTTLSMLCGLLGPDEGDACLMGHSIRREARAAKAALGVVPQDVALYPDLTARENLAFWGRMYGLSGAALRQRVDEVLALIGLADRQGGRVGTFSGGMKRRVNLGVALLHKPPVVVMDEPTVGIDPQSRRHILDNVKALNRQGMTVLYTTQRPPDRLRHARRADPYGGRADAHRRDAERRSGPGVGCLAGSAGGVARFGG
jgi:ABC-2 type transport system ATP-binding protein